MCKKKMKSCGTQTDITYSRRNNCFMQTNKEGPDGERLSTTDTDDSMDDELDESYLSQMSQESDTNSMSDSESELSSYDPLNDTKLIVFWSTLLPLLSFCLVCRASAHITHTYYKGCAIVVPLFCTSNHETMWCSMPKINGMFAANLLIPASILFTGTTYSRFNEICDAFGLRCLGKTLYNSIQKKYLFPCIHKIYKTF